MIKINNNGLNNKQLNELQKFLNLKIKDIYNFFEINDLNIKIDIIETKKELNNIFYIDFEEHASDYVVGWTNDNDNVINMLNYNDYEHTAHGVINFDDYMKTVLHECIHLVHANYCNKDYPITCIYEGIACYLSKQYENVDLSGRDLLKVLDDNADYGLYYLLIKKMYDFLPKDIFMSILKNETDSLPYIEKIIKN